jgi:hypothetical protein
MDSEDLKKYSEVRNFLAQNLNIVVDVKNIGDIISIFIEEEREGFRMFVCKKKEDESVEHFPANLFLAAKILAENYEITLKNLN